MPDADARRDGFRHVLIAIAAVALTVPLAAFFCFVGYMKSFAPLSTLEQHHAWTTALPAWLGRMVGASELACAAALVLGLVWSAKRGWARIAAAVLVVNQIAAAAVHQSRGESEALPQNLVLILMLGGLLLSLAAWRKRLVD